MKPLRYPVILAAAVAACAAPAEDKLPLLSVWEDGQVAFGVFVPNEQPPTREQLRAGERPAPVYTEAGGRALAEDPLLDYVFLNLEGRYDASAVAAIRAGLDAETATSRKALLVRIPPIADAGEDTTRQRVIEIMNAGADGVVFPHVRTPAEAATAIAMMRDADADIWSPQNRSGDKIAMIMIEDPGALEQVEAFAALEGYSVLACGIGSLTRAMGGDREAAEAGNLAVLQHAQAAGLADMITANARNVEQRIQEGFPALLMSGSNAAEVIATGRSLAGRDQH